MWECQTSGTRSDPDLVERRAEQLMKEFVRARARGDKPAMQRWWGELLTLQFDRLIAMVKRHAQGVVFGSEIDDAISEAAMRMALKAWRQHEGDTVGSFNATMSTVCRFSCREVQRKAARVSKRRGGSLDAVPRDGHEAPGWADSTYADFEAERLRAHAEEEERRETLAADRDFVAWAVPQLPGRPREVFELLLEGRTPTEIMERLGMERNAVDQNKRRAVQALRKLKEQYPS